MSNNFFIILNKKKNILNNLRKNLTTNSSNLLNFNLLNILINSYNNFFQFGLSKNNRKNIGLNKILKKLFPIILDKYNIILDFLDYYIVYPEKSYNFCIKNGLTYSLILKIKFQIKQYVEDKNIISNVENEIITLANIPMMTLNGSFVIEGVEKAIVSKFVISPGLYLILEKKGKKIIHIARLIPDIGGEMDFLLINNDLLIKTKMNQISLITVFKALGLNRFDIINEFYNLEIIRLTDSKNFELKFNKELFLNSTFQYDITNSLNEVLVYKNNIITLDDILNIEKNKIEYLKIDKDYLLNRFFLNDIYNNNEKILDSNKSIDNNAINLIINNNIKEISLIYISTNAHYCIVLALNNNKLNYIESCNCLKNFFEKIGFSFLEEKIINYDNHFNNDSYFDISDICREKLKYRFGEKIKKNFKYLNLNDLFNIIKLLIAFKDKNIFQDDTYNLGNLSLHLIGDILEKKIFDYINNIKKNINKKNIFNDEVELLPKNFLNFKLLDLIIKNFFVSSEYSQYLDQVNCLSELSHKRRVSLFGVIGVSKKYSGFNVRDLNISHYSRLCPVETPEGINIGLVNSLALFTSINEYKFLLAPFYRTLNRKIIKKLVYLNVEDENKSIISDSTCSIFNGFLKNEEITARYNEQLITVNSNLIDFIDYTPCQILSVCTCLIPFLEHNDSNRALMAANMLKQALPCLIPQAPLIGTGFEKLIGNNTSNILISNSEGIVVYVDSKNIIIKKRNFLKNNTFISYDFFSLKKYISSNQNTSISQRLNVSLNDKISIGTILADNSCTKNGEISLGQNMLVAFMSWGGYNFEDSIIVSEKVVIDEKYTSLEVLNVDIPVYNTENGVEIITRNIYNYNNLNLKNLDDFGIIKVGSLVKDGDLILGKKTPILESDVNKTNEEKLLHSIFLDDIENYKDSSYYLPKNISNGVVSDVKIFFSSNYNLTEDDKKILDKQNKDFFLKKEKKFLKFMKKFKKELLIFLNDEKDYLLMKEKFKSNIKICDLFKISLKDNKLNFFFINLKKKFYNFIKHYNSSILNINDKFIKNLSFNIIKLVRVNVIIKRKLQVGDKLSGRHGNKGVISKILPVSEMPYLKNGRTIDMILNPLGITSRMNAGQLLEIHLGLASMALGWKIEKFLKENKINLLKNLLIKIYSFNEKKDIIDNFSENEIINLSETLKNGIPFGVMAFNKFKESDINYLLNLAFEDSDIEISSNKKQVYLYDGDTGKKFENPITIGIMYMLKLNHLVENKIHARSVGPYSLITQQPLKGKANLGGQRIGEMEVWALQAYGAAYTLQDMITIKSDDINGRINLYKNIVNNVTKFSSNIPESFNVMLKNINSLGICVVLN